MMKITIKPMPYLATFLFLILLINLIDMLRAQEMVPTPVNSYPFEVCKTCQSYFQKQEEYAFAEMNALKNKALWDTHSVLILKDKKIVFERYSSKTSVEKPHRLWSMSKSITSLLVGIREKEGKLSRSDYLTKYYPALHNRPDKSTLTLEHLLTMSSGINWQESYEGNPFQSDVVRMLYLKENKDMPAFVLAHHQRHHPGNYFYYSSGETNLLMGVLKKSFPSLEEYQNYPWKMLFDPLEIRSATWETDHTGNFVGSSYLYMSARDLVKIGQLVLDGGRGFISSDYFLHSFIPHSASCKTKRANASPAYSYGYYWWLNAPCFERPTRKKAYAALPDNLIMALGHQGQIMAIFPTQKAVAVRFAADKRGHFDREVWLEAVYQNLKKFEAGR